MGNIIRQILVVLATAGVIAVNALANILPFNNKTTGEISDAFDVYFVPAGYVFAIWGLIYVALAAYSIYQALPAQRENPRLQRIGYLYILSCLANGVWLVLWHYEYFAWTMVAMGALLLLLIAIYLLLGIGRVPVSRAEKWMVHVPFSLYLGWITVATIANATDLLYSLNWDGWGIGPEWWAVIMLVVATVVAVLVCLTRGDVAYGLVIVWAFAGIVVSQIDTLLVAIVAGVMAFIVLVMALVGASRATDLRPAQPGRAVRDRW